MYLKGELLPHNYLFLDSCSLLLDAVLIHHTYHRLYIYLNIQFVDYPHAYA